MSLGQNTKTSAVRDSWWQDQDKTRSKILGLVLVLVPERSLMITIFHFELEQNSSTLNNFHPSRYFQREREGHTHNKENCERYVLCRNVRRVCPLVDTWVSIPVSLRSMSSVCDLISFAVNIREDLLIVECLIEKLECFVCM